MLRLRHKEVAVPLIAVVFTLFTALAALSACQLDGDAAGAGAQALPEVYVGRLICGGHLPLAVVEHLYQQELAGFRLKTVQNHDWNDVVRDMESGKLAGSFMLSPLAMQLIRTGVAAKIVLKADRNGNGFVLDKRIASIEALRGTRAIIAVPHTYSQHHVLLHLLLKQHDVPRGNITVIAMPPRDMIAALRRGEIDGFVVGEPEASKAAMLGVGWLAAISPGVWRDHPDHVFVASDRFIREQPERLQQLVSALLRAGRFIEASPKAAAKMGEAYTGSDAAVFARVLTDPPDWIDYSDMLPSISDLEAMAGHMVDMGLWQDMPADMTMFTDTRFIQRAIAQAGRN